ncbi:MAG: metallophosphoesterase [Clostridiales bacterium]|nr:metallophosphoesterase [Clostridiales bacterium]
MPSSDRISKVRKTACHVPFDDSSKLILMSDCHRGDGNWEDTFAHNQTLYYSALSHYYAENYTYIELGDGDDLWKNKSLLDITRAHNNVFELLNKFHEKGRIHLIYGNHDIVKGNDKWLKKNFFTYINKQEDKKARLLKGAKIHNGIILKHTVTGDEILLLHGHQADFINNNLWKLSRFLVRYLWRPLEQLGVHDPTLAAMNYSKRDLIERKLIAWVQANKQMLIAGHTHRPVFPDAGRPPYFNDGCCVHPYSITGIEIANGEISLVKWSVKTRPDGVLLTGKDMIAGPNKLTGYFSYNKAPCQRPPDRC